MFDHVTRADAGIYTCTVWGDGGASDSGTTRLTVVGELFDRIEPHRHIDIGDAPSPQIEREKERQREREGREGRESGRKGEGEREEGEKGESQGERERERGGSYREEEDE